MFFLILYLLHCNALPLSSPNPKLKSKSADQIAQDSGNNPLGLQITYKNIYNDNRSKFGSAIYLSSNNITISGKWSIKFILSTETSESGFLLPPSSIAPDVNITGTGNFEFSKILKNNVLWNNVEYTSDSKHVPITKSPLQLIFNGTFTKSSQSDSNVFPPGIIFFSRMDVNPIDLAIKPNIDHSPVPKDPPTWFSSSIAPPKLAVTDLDGVGHPQGTNLPTLYIVVTILVISFIAVIIIYIRLKPKE